MTTPVGNVGSPIGNVGESTGFSTGTSSSSKTGPDTKMDKDMFLKLLVAQMKYQDPSKPTDASQFLAQTAQFTLVEKMDQLASSQAAMFETNQLQSATALVGCTVAWTSQDIKGDDVQNSGVVTGVSISGGVPTLLVDDQELALSDVSKITKPS